MLTRVTDSTHAGEARRYAAVLGEEAQFGERERGALAIVVTEITTNVLKHVGSGLVMSALFKTSDLRSCWWRIPEDHAAVGV